MASLLQYTHPELAATHPDPATAVAWVVQLGSGPITLGRSRYAEDSLAQALRSGVHQYVILGAGFDTFAYLTREVVFDTLQGIAAIATPGSTIVFDYLDADAFIPEKAGKYIQQMQWMAAHLGEPLKAGFDPLGLAADLDRLGLRLEENLAPADIEDRYYQGRLTVIMQPNTSIMPEPW